MSTRYSFRVGWLSLLCFTLFISSSAKGGLFGSDKSDTDIESELIVALGSPNVSRVTDALQDLEKRFPHSEAGKIKARQLLRDPREPVRRKTARVLGSLRAEVTEDDLEIIGKMLQSPSTAEKVDALKTLRTLGNDRQVTAILPLLSATDTGLVRDACRTLAVLGSPNEISAIEPLLQHQQPAIRKDAEYAIKKLEFKETLASISKQSSAQSNETNNSFETEPTVIDQHTPKAIQAQAERGDVEAQAKLGSMFSEGREVEKDFVEAYAWMNLAARSDAESATNRDALEMRMTPQQIADGQKRTRELRISVDQNQTSAFPSLPTKSGVAANNPARRVTPNGVIKETHIGGSIFKEERRKKVRGLLGIPGPSEFAGFVELRYQGLSPDGKLILRFTEMETELKPRQSSVSASANLHQPTYVNGVYNSGTTTIHGRITHSPEALPPNTTEFTFDPTKETELSIAGYRVRFLEFTSQKLKYSHAK